MEERLMSATAAAAATRTAQIYKSSYKPIWCPGCGDYSVLSSVTKALALVGAAPENVAVVSGIGCSSRLPAYTTCYGFHGVHGRALAAATGNVTERGTRSQHSLGPTDPDLAPSSASGFVLALAVPGVFSPRAASSRRRAALLSAVEGHRPSLALPEALDFALRGRDRGARRGAEGRDGDGERAFGGLTL